MFNLIVAGRDWKPNRDSFPRERVLEFTSPELKNQLTPDNFLDIETVSSLPTIFMAEDGRENSGIARVGTLTGVRKSGSDYELEYAYDLAIPPISNSHIRKLSVELRIGDWEFTRTHWAVKDADLYYVLLRNGTTRFPQPRVFQLSDEPVDERLISVMMPFNTDFDQIYSSLAEAIRRIGMRCQRADNIWNHDAVIQDVVSLICTSSIVICDLSGKNSNVFYETGIAHTLGRQVILIAQSPDDVPFDLQHLRFVQYHNDGEGRTRLAEQVKSRIKALDAAR